MFVCLIVCLFVKRRATATTGCALLCAALRCTALHCTAAAPPLHCTAAAGAIAAGAERQCDAHRLGVVAKPQVRAVHLDTSILAAASTTPLFRRHNPSKSAYSRIAICVPNATCGGCSMTGYTGSAVAQSTCGCVSCFTAPADSGRLGCLSAVIRSSRSERSVACSRQRGTRDRYVARAWRIAALRSSTGVPRRFGDIPLGSCCGRSFHDLRIEFPRGLGVIQVCAQAVASDDRIHRFRFDPIDRLADCAVP